MVDGAGPDDGPTSTPNSHNLSANLDHSGHVQRAYLANFPSPDAQGGQRATMSAPTAEWERVGDRFYRKIQLYQGVFDQDLELENYVVVGAPLSGAVGETRQIKHKLRWS